MDALGRIRYLGTDIAVIAVVAVAVVALALAGSQAGGSNGVKPDFTVEVRESPAGVRPLPPGFLGLSLEYPAVEAYAGSDPRAINPVFEQLVGNLAPGQDPVVRIGGDSADWTWWPVPGVSRPPGVSFSLDQRWLQVTRAMTAALRARLILALNLEADSAELAADEADALASGLGRDSIEAFELGNEPELYGALPWYRTAGGSGVLGRSSRYDFAAFADDFAAVAADLPAVPLAGPTISGSGWVPDVGEFLDGEPRVRLVAVHEYPLQLCFVRRSSVRYPTVRNLLAPAASTGLANRFVEDVGIAHARGLPLRADELNTVSCGGDAAVSQTFASALWVLDALFELARVGVDGVNIHTFPGAGYGLFGFSEQGGRWHGWVGPEYYGLLLFARAAPPGSTLLDVSEPRAPAIKVWATRTPGGALHVVLINKDTRHSHTVAVRLLGRHGRASLERLEAPGFTVARGVTLAGQSFGAQTFTGRLGGRLRKEGVSAAHGSYAVLVPPASAALLSFRDPRG